MTIKLYDDNSYLKEFTANVVSCEKTEGGYAVILDQTAFFPTEGGQACDSGTLSGVRVTNVTLKGDDIVHVTESKLCGSVVGSIDFDERFDKMQQHTAEHIVCGIVHTEYGYNNVGFHLGADDVTFDFDGPLDKDQVYDIELRANALLQKDAKIRCYYPENPQEEEYRSKSGIEGSIRIVDIEGIDKCACCAPHLSSTAQVGMIHFTDWYPYKSGIRIHMACGQRALRKLQSYVKNLRDISNQLSSGTENAALFFKKYASDHSDTLKKVSDLKKELVMAKAEATAPSQDTLTVFEPSLEAGILRQYANALSGKYKTMLFVFGAPTESGYPFIAASETVDMRNVANELRTQLLAKCGGSEKMIQGSVLANEQQLRQFIENIN